MMQTDLPTGRQVSIPPQAKDTRTWLWLKSRVCHPLHVATAMQIRAFHCYHEVACAQRVCQLKVVTVTDP